MPRRVLSTILAPTMIIVVGLVAFFWLKSYDAPPERTQIPPSPPIVQTIVFEPVDSDFEIRIGGNVVPGREVTISAQVAGTIVEKSDDLDGGRFVSQGTSLLKIDPANYQLEVKAIGRELQQVAGDLRRLEVEKRGNAELIRIAEGKLEIATRELARIKTLFASKAATESELDEAQRIELETSNALQLLRNVRDVIPIRKERLEAEQKLMKLKRQQAQLSLDRTSIVAPFDGIITNDAAEQGDFVQPGDVLLEIEETAPVEVKCNLRMDDLYWLWDSQRPGPLEGPRKNENLVRESYEIPHVSATVTYTVGGHDFHWLGTLARYEGQGIDGTTRTVPCRVIVADPKRANAADGPPALMRGMYVTITLPISPRTTLWRLPSRAVQPNGQVWTVKGDKLRIHRVKPARVLADSVLIRADQTDLKASDHIVVSQLATAFEGMQVREAAEAGRAP